MVYPLIYFKCQMTGAWSSYVLQRNKSVRWHLLDISEKFPDRFSYPATTTLSLVCYRLAWPHRLKDCIICFGHGKSWLSTIFQLHLCSYYTSISGDHGFIDGTHKQTCRPRPETIDQEEPHSGHKHRHSMQFLAVVTPDGLISCLDGPYERRKGDWGMWREGLQKTVVRMMATGRSIWWQGIISWLWCDQSLSQPEWDCIDWRRVSFQCIYGKAKNGCGVGIWQGHATFSIYQSEDDEVRVISICTLLFYFSFTYQLVIPVI